MVLFSWLLAVLAVAGGSPTPQQAAIAVGDIGLKKPPVVTRINLVGAYAMVLTRGAAVEGHSVTSPILVERFSFGWQALEIVNFRCSLDVHALGAHVDARLMQSMPTPQDDRPCRGLYKDAGPRTDVLAVRKKMRGPLIPSVVVSGDWALGEWYGGGGGQSLYRKRNEAWALVTSVGGAMGIAEMLHYGVPRSAWCAFGIYDAKCPR